jgi:hypothetical protein
LAGGAACRRRRRGSPLLRRRRERDARGDPPGQAGQGKGSAAYLHTDTLGSTDLVTDGAGSIVQRRSYDAFGARRHPVWGQAPAGAFASKRWLIRVLTARTLDAVLRGPSRGTARKAAPAARAR